MWEKLTAIVEIAAGEDAKYELQPNGRLKLIRFIPGSRVFPGSYGEIPESLAEDGDPLDVLILAQGRAIRPGVEVDVVPLGMLKLVDSGEKDWKLIATLAGGGAGVDVLNDEKKATIWDFFEHYKDLEPSKTAIVEEWHDRAAAWDAITAARAAYTG